MPINSTDRRRRRCGGGRYVHERCDIQFITHPYPHTISSSTDLRRRVLNRWVVCVVYNVIIIIIIIIISYYHSRRRTHCCYYERARVCVRLRYRVVDWRRVYTV